MRSVTAAGVVTLLLAACGGSPRGEVVVSAAASLGDVFSTLEREYEASHPDVDIVLNFGGSSALREQILAGAPVDVFAPASVPVMAEVASAGLLDGEAVVFATNHLVMVVPSGNPGRLTGLQDLANEALLVGLCAPEVPCGALSSDVLDAAGVRAAPDTYEPDVRALRTKVALGELDAGLVYASDVVGQDALEVIDTGFEEVTTLYPIGVLSTSGNRDHARQFVALVLSPTGAAAVSDAGFGSP